MLGSIIRNVLAGIVALMLAQGGAMAATISYTPNSGTDEVDEELALGGGIITADFTPDPSTHADNGNFTDYFLIDITGNVDTLAVVFGGFPAPGGDPNDFTLTLFEDVVIGGGQIAWNDVTDLVTPTSGGIGTAFFQGLTDGSYVMRVDYLGDPISGYVGQITATPLPPALLIFGTGLLGLGVLSRYRRKRQGQLGLQA